MEFTPAHFNKKTLEKLYRRYNREEYISSDPLKFVYEYDSAADREVVGLIVSSLAYGRVAQIKASVARVLDVMGRHPVEFIRGTSPSGTRKKLAGFKHRFTTGEHVAGMLCGVRTILKKHGSLENCFFSCYRDEHETVIPALEGFVAEMSGGNELKFLLPSPGRGSACKRLNLYLCWMVRKDNVCPGVWSSIPASALVVPVDTHIHRISLAMGITTRKQADLKTALEVTAAFRNICPGDPAKYDFALTRPGIMNLEE